jgi:hypothetical protein
VPYWGRVLILHHLRRVLCLNKHSSLGDSERPMKTNPQLRKAHRVSMKMKGELVEKTPCLKLFVSSCW